MMSSDQLRALRNSSDPYEHRTERAMQDKWYARRAMRVLSHGSEEVPRTLITHEASARWPWLFARPAKYLNIYQRARRTALGALGRCHPVAMPIFADRLCELAPLAAECAAIVRAWRERFDAALTRRTDPNPTVAALTRLARRVTRPEEKDQ